MRKKLDLVGKKYERLLVIAESPSISGQPTRWLCKCDCGNETIVFGMNLKRGLTRSCGCYSKESHLKHGMSKRGEGAKNNEYSSWQHMKARCCNPNNEGYKDYGAKGITISPRWIDSFDNFYEDMGPKPSNRHTLDRYPNKEGNYEPGNCRWATESEQKRNLIRNIWITHEGRTMVAADWTKELGIPHWRIRHFTIKGYSLKEIIEKHEKTLAKKCNS